MVGVQIVDLWVWILGGGSCMPALTEEQYERLNQSGQTNYCTFFDRRFLLGKVVIAKVSVVSFLDCYRKLRY